LERHSRGVIYDRFLFIVKSTALSLNNDEKKYFFKNIDTCYIRLKTYFSGKQERKKVIICILANFRLLRREKVWLLASSGSSGVKALDSVPRQDF
jgi:hypothetical protein